MKRTLIAVAAALLLVTGFASAQDANITIGTWINDQFAPIASDGDRNYTGMSTSWGGLRETRISVTGTAADNLAGFKADYFVNNKSVGLGDNGYIWVQPIDQIKISAGTFDSTEMGFRGDLSFGSWNWIRPSFVGYDEGLTFSGNNSGFAVQLLPIEGLTVYGLVPVDNITDDYAYTYTIWGNAEAAVKYAIDGVGTIKVGYFGKYKKDGDYERYGDIEAAFDLTAVDGLFVTAGFQYRLGDDESLLTAAKAASKSYYLDTTDGSIKSNDVDASDAEYGYNMKIALGASYAINDDFKVSASGRVFLYPSDFEVDPTFDVGGGISYYVLDGLELVADVRYHSETKVDGNGKEDDGLSFMVGVDKTVGSNGLIGVGFQGVTNGQGFNKHLQYEDKFAWAVPIRVMVGL